MENTKSLTREQFDLLEALITSAAPLTASKLAEKTGYDLRTVSNVLSELTTRKYVDDGRITDIGKAAMEPYGAKRAIFIAAGFGSRLVPVTLNTPKPLVRVNGVRILDRLIDACLAADIPEIYIVRGYLAEQFDVLRYKYPSVRFLENPYYNEANNISSAMIARHMLSNAFVLEADLLISNPAIIKKYHYSSDFLAIRKDKTDDWCFRVNDGIITEEMTSGEGSDIWQMVGISYWNTEDGQNLFRDIEDVYQSPEGTKRYWEQVPLVYRKENYAVAVRACREEDIIEIDTFAELKVIDKAYDV